MAITVPAYDQDSDLNTPSVTFAYASANDETLVALITANSYGATDADHCRISSVIDDAHNVWVEGVTIFCAASSTDPYVSVRVSIWYCVAARAVSKVTVSTTQVVDSLAVSVVRTTAVRTSSPVIQTNSGQSNNTPTTTPASSGSVTVPGGLNAICLGVTAVGDTGVTMTPSATTWTALSVVDTASLTAKDNLRHRAAYRVISASAAQSINWNLSPNAAAAWCFIAFAEGTISTANANPRWPAITHEAGFGVDPNDPAMAESWTDITSRVNGFMSRRGRDYELARTEAGELQVDVNNYDSRFDPLNASGTYYPNVRVITPYRVRATWNGQLYRLFTGYVERWPQKWVDERGTSRLQVVDGLATLSNTQLFGSLGAEIIADEPFAYWPLDDGALASGAANKATQSTTSLAIATSANGGGGGGFGYDLSMQSEQSSCWRQYKTGLTALSADQYGGCLTGSMVLPQLTDGIILECWAKFPAYATSTLTYSLLALKGTAFSSNALHRIVLLTIDSVSGLPTLNVSDSSGALQPYTGSASGFNDDAWHHYVVHVTTSTARLWVDGTLRATGAPSSVPGATIDLFEAGGEVDTWANQGIVAGDFAHVAIFEAASVDDRRVAVRANAGLTGFPELTGSRMTRLLNYAGWQAGRAIDGGLTFLGPAATIARQTILAAAQDVASWENGLVFVDGSGYLRFVARDTHFNQVSKFTFGENSAGGEIPYQTDVEIEYDPRYVYNDVTVTRSMSRLPDGTVLTGSSSAHQKDDASIMSYFTRTYDKTSGANSLSQCDAEATWVLENYAQPRARLARITITPSANVSLWPTALGMEIGDKVTVKRRPFGGGDVITLTCYIEQIAHRVQPGQWDVVVSLSPALLTTYAGQDSWVLGTSVLGVDTILGSP